MKKFLAVVSILILSYSTGIKAQGLVFNDNARPTAIKEPGLVIENANDSYREDSNFIIQAADHRSERMFGLKAGFNMSNVCNKGLEFETTPIMGWTAGAFLTMPLGKLFGFQPEFRYTEKGFRANGSIAYTDYSFKRKTVYVDIPLLIQVKPGKCFSLFAGPMLSFLIHSSDKFYAGTATSDEKLAITGRPVNKNVLGAEAGLDIYIQKVVASLRTGLDINELKNKTTSNSGAYKNSWIQVTVGYNLF